MRIQRRRQRALERRSAAQQVRRTRDRHLRSTRHRATCRHLSDRRPNSPKDVKALTAAICLFAAALIGRSTQFQILSAGLPLPETCRSFIDGPRARCPFYSSVPPREC